MRVSVCQLVTVVVVQANPGKVRQIQQRLRAWVPQSDRTAIRFCTALPETG